MYSGISNAGAEVDISTVPTSANKSLNRTTFLLSDHLGSAQMELSSAGWPLSSSQFTPFGAEMNPQVTTNHYKFTGKERDTESGLDYFGARYYASSMGRWMSPDWADKPEAVPYSVLGNPQSFNLYAYVTNNPMSQRDLDGHAETGNACGSSNSTCDAADDDTNGVEIQQDIKRARDKARSSIHSPSFLKRVGQRLNNLVHNNGFLTNAELEDVHGAFASAYIVPGSVQVTQPNPYITLALDATGIVTTVTGHGNISAGISVTSSVYNPDPTNVILNATSLFPGMLGTAAIPLTAVNDVGGMAGGFITNNILAPMFQAIPGNTMDDGHPIPTPDSPCMANGTC